MRTKFELQLLWKFEINLSQDNPRKERNTDIKRTKKQKKVENNLPIIIKVKWEYIATTGSVIFTPIGATKYNSKKSEI